MSQDSDGSKTPDSASRGTQARARARLGRDLAAMFEDVAAQPLPEDLLDLVDQLERQRDKPAPSEG